MKFSILNSAFKGPLSIVADIAQKSGTMPILANILFREGQLVACDGQSQISCACPVKGDFTAPAEKLKKIISSFADDATLDFELKGDKLTIKSGRSKLSVPVIGIDAFPIPKLDGTMQVVTMKQDDIKYHIQNVIHSMAVNDVRQWANGIVFRHDKKLLVGSTTGIVLALSEQLIDAEPFEFTLPSTQCNRVIKLMGEGDVTLHIYSNKIVFLLGDIEFISSRVEQPFIDVMRAVPKLESELITFDKVSFMQASSRAAINASKYAAACVSVSNNTMTITCKDFDADSTDSIGVSYSGPDVEFGYNILQMRDAVDSICSSDVRMHISSLGEKPTGTALFISNDEMQRNVISAMRI